VECQPQVGVDPGLHHGPGVGEQKARRQQQERDLAASLPALHSGYGDHHPVTAPGRLIVVGLMVVGIALVGAVTASVAAWTVSQADVPREPPA
jgi:hypothetical protein